MVPLLLIGAGGHTKSCIDVIEKEGKFQIAGLIGQNNEVNKSILGYKIIGSDLDLPNLRKKYEFAFITIGQIKTPSIRIKMFQILKQLNFQIPVIQSPFAIISKNSEIGEGTIIHHGTILNADSSIGINCIINSGALIEHDCIIGEHSHIATKAVINGNVTVGARTFVGSGTVIKNGVTIGNDCTIGMAEKIKSNVPPFNLIKNY